MIRLPDQLALEGLCHLGSALPTPALLGAVVTAVTGDPQATCTSVQAKPVDYAFSSISTAGLYRVRGTADTADRVVPWSVFVKVLQHPRHWRLIDTLPPGVAAELKERFPWRDELNVREQVLPVLPPGLRVPDLYQLAELGDDRLAVWMEDIDVDDDAWNHATYARAAHLLARLAARRTPDRPAGSSDLPPGLAVHKVVGSRAPAVADLLADQTLWHRPLVRAVVDPDYRADLGRLMDTLPRIVSEMDTLPTSLPHGDAAPVNLLRPVTDRSTFVAIDWSFGCQLPLGFDLGQLLVGEAERGRMEPAELPALLDVVLAAYVDGLEEEGLDVPSATVRRGMLVSLATRTAPGALPLEQLEEQPSDEQVAFLRRRAGLGRFVLDEVRAG